MWADHVVVFIAPLCRRRSRRPRQQLLREGSPNVHTGHLGVRSMLQKIDPGQALSLDSIQESGFRSDSSDDGKASRTYKLFIVLVTILHQDWATPEDPLTVITDLRFGLSGMVRRTNPLWSF